MYNLMQLGILVLGDNKFVVIYRFSKEMKALEKARKKAEAICDTVDVSEKEKMSQIQRRIRIGAGMRGRVLHQCGLGSIPSSTLELCNFWKFIFLRHGNRRVWVRLVKVMMCTVSRCLLFLAPFFSISQASEPVRSIALLYLTQFSPYHYLRLAPPQSR